MTFVGSKRLAGPGYIILNGLRIMNIIGLLSLICASMVMIVKTAIDSQFFFFDAISHVINAAASTLLVLSEVGVFPRYFARNWPLLSVEHGFVALGTAMVVLGVDTLGDLNKPAMSKENLGLAFWRIVVGSGIVSTILGVFNIIANFLFRDRVSGVTARQVRIHGAVAIAEGRAQAAEQARGKTYTFTSTSSPRPTSPNLSSPSKSTATAKADPMTPPRQKQKPRKSFRFTRFGLPVLPSYRDAASPVPSSKYSGDEEMGLKGDPPMRGRDISGPLNINPQFAHLIKPDNAYHPSRAKNSY